MAPKAEEKRYLAKHAKLAKVRQENISRRRGDAENAEIQKNKTVSFPNLCVLRVSARSSLQGRPYSP